jgi:hypothetical protein
MPRSYELPSRLNESVSKERHVYSEERNQKKLC